VALYAAERHGTDRSKLEAFEMWIWRRTEKISWVDRKTDEEILNMVEEDRILCNAAVIKYPTTLQMRRYTTL